MSQIRFIEESHQYFNGDNIPYISVSGLADLIKEKTDWEPIKKKKAKELGITVAELEKEWERKRIAGTNAGTAIHLKKEQELLSTEDLKVNNVRCNIKPCSHFNGWKYSLLDDKLENNTVYPEAMIFNDTLKVAGQSDKVVIVNNTINVIDYKTDKKMDRQAYSDKWKGPKKLLAPVSHLQDCEIDIYSLKMSMYMRLLWAKNKHLKIGDLILEWHQLERDEDTVPILGSDGLPIVKRVEIIKVPYLRKEVKDIFDWYKEGKLK